MNEAVTVIMQRVPPSSYVCGKCGADSGCGCGERSIPRAEFQRLFKERLDKAVLENSKKSDRAIATELGVSPTTVGKARANNCPHVDSSKRIGLDGKARKPPTNRTQRHAEPRAKRVADIRTLVADGNNAEQIAAAIGIDVERVRLIANEENIKIPLTKMPRITAHRLIKKTVEALADYTDGLKLLPTPIRDVTAAEASEWIAAIDASLRAIKQLRKQLQEILK